jgi:hypothetical protein
MSFKKNKLLEIIDKEKLQELKAIYDRDEMIYLKKIFEINE